MTDKPDSLYIPYSGPSLLEMPLLNKGSAFTARERKEFNLSGLLPTRYETIDDQVERAYMQFSRFDSPLNQHIYLRAIQDNNETLFYRLVQDHIEEMLPIIYTPTVGDACEQFSDIYRKFRGLFISYEDRHQIDDILRNATKRKVRVIVVTDGSRILGLGDQGIGGMGIPIGKLSLYTACGGISPAYTLPVMLDVGTNNQRLLDDPRYMGARHRRIERDDYDQFIDLFMRAVKRRWPEVMIQFEDFSQPNAMPILNRYRQSYCCFNDDIQGTAAITLGTLLAACRIKGRLLSTLKVVFVGAGSAGCGIAEMLVSQMRNEGLSDKQARQQVFMVDRFGLLCDDMENLRDFQQALSWSKTELTDWEYSGEYPVLMDVLRNTKPHILIGVSGQSGLFTEQVVKTMHEHCPTPIIFPLSNPSKQIEARPAQVIEWTQGDVVIATGSPFMPVSYEGKDFHIAQCNNSYIFPGLGLGVYCVKAAVISNEMLMSASEALAETSPLANEGKGGLLPPLTDITEVSRKIAFAVAKTAIEQGHARPLSDEQLLQRIDENFWKPVYRPYKRVSF